MSRPRSNAEDEQQWDREVGAAIQDGKRTGGPGVACPDDFEHYQQGQDGGLEKDLPGAHPCASEAMGGKPSDRLREWDKQAASQPAFPPPFPRRKESWPGSR